MCCQLNAVESHDPSGREHCKQLHNTETLCVNRGQCLFSCVRVKSYESEANAFGKVIERVLPLDKCNARCSR